ncbi:replication protein RepA [Terasakiella sp.]|uniref:replication protein RepA n=1 Tax=Terasakiella sp. TaxID=2034861 RepID=UPI003AA7F49A
MRYRKVKLSLPYTLKNRNGEDVTLETLIWENGASEAIQRLQQDFIQPIDIRAIEAASRYWSAQLHPPLTLHSNFTRFALPMDHPKSKTEEWQRINNDFKCILSSGHIPKDNNLIPAGLPFGSKARLILIYINTEAYRNDYGIISMGKSLSEFMKKLGIHVTGGQNGSIRYIKEQAARLARCRFQFYYPKSFDSEYQIEDLAFANTQLWEITSNKNSWVTELRVNKDFKASLDKHSVVLDAVAISILRNRPFALDWYIFLAFRLQATTREKLITWANLYGQLGSRTERIIDFKIKSIDALKLVSAVFPTARLNVTGQGVWVQPSIPVKNRIDSWLGGKTHIQAHSQALDFVPAHKKIKGENQCPQLLD